LAVWGLQVDCRLTGSDAERGRSGERVAPVGVSSPLRGVQLGNGFIPENNCEVQKLLLREI